MENISIFDILKIGVGPSSSHTLGPWRAAQRFIKELKDKKIENKITEINIVLFGSLSLTGKGHATDSGIMLGLSGKDPVSIPIEEITIIISKIKSEKILNLTSTIAIPFNPEVNIIFSNSFLPFHSNALTFKANGIQIEHTSTFYSVGGGFIVKEGEQFLDKTTTNQAFPYPIRLGVDLLDYCKNSNAKISDLIYANELTLRNSNQIDNDLLNIWQVMLDSMYIGCHTKGTLPGGLGVERRASGIYKNLKSNLSYSNANQWFEAIKKTKVNFRGILKWVSCFALAVNEVNASLGRVVTAPTNGSAGVIPAVLSYYLSIENHEARLKEIKEFLLVAGQIGILFKQGATISASMGGCQAEIGVSSAMAAAGLCELLGGSPEQVLIAAEIAMEHHLGLTCDPIGGLVQIPCIERNTMGAIKAIQAAELALETDPRKSKVPFDKVVKTMWETSKDMSIKYKETSQGGLAIGVNITEC